MQEQVHIVAVAGGAGTRFWPLSRKSRPKQLLTLTGDRPLLAETFERVRPMAPPSRWWMVVGGDTSDRSSAAVPELPPAQVLAEPMGRNTAPAIALAAHHIYRVDPDGIMIVLPADHHVADQESFQRALGQAIPAARDGAIAVLGITPRYPETGYGYIEQGLEAGDGTFVVKRFCEKPDLTRAKAFVEGGRHHWNAGIFVLRASRMIDEMAAQLPQHARLMTPVAQAIGSDRYGAALTKAYSEMDPISIDYGVMEGATEVRVVPVACGWSDVGTFRSFYDLLSPTKDDQGNVAKGLARFVDSAGCFSVGENGRLVAVLGMKDTMVVEAEGVTLVAPISRAQDVKEVVELIRSEGAGEWL